MIWEAWTLIVIFVVGALATIALIGKPRDPFTPGTGVFTVLIAAFEIWLVCATTSELLLELEVRCAMDLYREDRIFLEGPPSQSELLCRQLRDCLTEEQLAYRTVGEWS